MTAENKRLKHTVAPAPFNYTGIDRRMERSVIMTMNNIWVGMHITLNLGRERISLGFQVFPGLKLGVS